MAAWTLEQARTQLNAWLEAELAVTTGQEYSIGSRRITRANLKEIREELVFWKNEVQKLEASANKKGTNRVYRVVPRDL